MTYFIMHVAQRNPIDNINMVTIRKLAYFSSNFVASHYKLIKKM